MVDPAIKTSEFDERFYNILSETIKQPLDESMLESDLEAIGLNSISFVKLVVALENEFDREFDDSFIVMEDFPTLRSFKQNVERLVKD